MIDVFDLRLGNIVMVSGKITRVCHLMGDEDYFEPVPIDDNWMAGFGFKLFPWGWVKKSSKDFGLRINLRTYSYDVSGNNPVKLESVHELQNLYRDLSKEDLIIPMI